MNAEIGKPLSDQVRHMFRKFLSIDDLKQLESELKASLISQGVSFSDLKYEAVGYRTMYNMSRMRNPQIVTKRNQKAFIPMYSIALKHKAKYVERMKVQKEQLDKEMKEIDKELEILD